MKSPLVAALLVTLPAAAIAQDAPLPDLNVVAAMVEDGRLAPAESELRRVLKLYDSPVARDLLGIVLGKQGRLNDAEKEFLRAIALDPDFLPARQHLGRLYLQQERAEEALNQLRVASRLGPLERELALQLAALERSRGNDSSAEAQLRSVAERFESVRALLQLARLQAERGQHRDATASLRWALEIAPNSEELLITLGRISLAAREPVPAARALEPLTRMYPTVAEYFYLLGVARLQLWDMDGSVEALERSLELEPERALTLIALGLAFNGQKRFAEARAALIRSLELEPGNVEALASLAEAEEGLAELEAAERHALRALAQVAKHHRANLILGVVRLKQGRYEEARDALQQAVAAEPGSPKAQYQLSLAYARLNDPGNSQRHLALYREALREAEEHLIELRTHAGLGVGGMKP